MSDRKWVTYGRTESGDDLQPLIWDHQPDDDEVDDVYSQLPEYELDYEINGGVEHCTVEALTCK